MADLLHVRSAAAPYVYMALHTAIARVIHPGVLKLSQGRAKHSWQGATVQVVQAVRELLIR